MSEITPKNEGDTQMESYINFRGRKLSRIGEKYDFHEENGHKTTKFAKVFSLESFSLYGYLIGRTRYTGSTSIELT